MYKTRLCLGVTENQFLIKTEEQIELFKKVGFDGFFSHDESADKIKSWKKLADSLGMIYQTIHGPTSPVKHLWFEGSETKGAVQHFKNCVNLCADNNIPILVMHAFWGFDKPDNDRGLLNFESIVRYAEDKGIKIAFENTEGEEYLAKVLKEFSESTNVGFCWDSGHEMCYNKGVDMLGLYGDRLLCTHLNDNLGISDFDGKIATTDDLHLLPFDGIADWKYNVGRLEKCNFDGIYTFEMNRKSHIGRHDNDKYLKMPIEEYITEVYARACRIAALREKND